MSRSLRIGLIAASVPLGLALVVGSVFFTHRLANGGEVLGDVIIDGVDIGGLSEEDALRELRALEERLRSTPIPVDAAGVRFELLGSDIDLEIDEATIVAEAMENGRTGGVFSEFGWWVGHFSDDPISLEVPYGFDADALEMIITDWEQTGLADPPFIGTVGNEGGDIVYQYPRAGTGIEAPAAMEAIEASLLDPERMPVAISTRFLRPVLTNEVIDEAVAEARALIAGDVVLTNPGGSKRVIVPREVIAESLLVRRDDSGEVPEFKMTMLSRPTLDYLAGFRPYMETEPVDAEINIDVETDEVDLVASTPVLAPDPAGVPVALDRAVRSASRTASLPYYEVRESEFSTADAEALGINGLIGEFTTFHACCESRVTNIQLIADAADGAWVFPGEVFSLNEHVGERTREKGYVAAGAIIRGELLCCDHPINIGGGTSQFTTTLYNAVFFAGLEDVEHQPHTIYFSRYPEGREATLGFPSPDIKFRNNTANLVVLRTTHTDTSITAKIYGDNGGLIVEAELSSRYNFTGPRGQKRTSPDVAPCTTKTVQSGSGGWSVDSYRYITDPDGTRTEEMWTWHYIGANKITETHPTKGPGSTFCKNQNNNP